MRLAWRVAEVASMLGVSAKSVRREIARKRLQARKLRGVVLILHRDLEEFVQSFPEAVPAVAATHLRRISNPDFSLERARALRETARRRA